MDELRENVALDLFWWFYCSDVIYRGDPEVLKRWQSPASALRRSKCYQIADTVITRVRSSQTN